MDYTEFANNVFSIMSTLGVLEPMKYFLLFVLSAAGLSVFIRLLTGSR